jgi:hypothetical protein
MDSTTSTHPNKTLWTNFANLFLGIWLIVSYAPLGYASTAMIANDVICGALLILFTIRIFSGCVMAPWAAAVIGIWLQLAPLVFWAPNAVMYLNDTLVGALVIAFSILIPGVPGKKKSVSEIPQGWSYNPSSWMQRLPVIALACLGWFLARYMAAYQLGYMSSIWDPFFGDGTLKVITSDLSKSFPISDAGLGAAAYTIETLMGCKGDQSRWKTMPWMVIFFGILVVPLGIISTLLIISQPLVVGAWCGICLITALAMVVMVALTVDEVTATLQFLKRSVRGGKSFWLVFWKGEEARGEKEDWRTPSFTSPLRKIFGAMFWGVNIPWTLLVSALLGVLLVSFPALFGYEGAAADNNSIFGALTVVVSLIAMAEVVRKGRLITVVFGGWILISAFLFGSETISLWVQFLQALIGLALICLSLPKGKIKERYGN